MGTKGHDETRRAVREHYATVAKGGTGCCGGTPCGTDELARAVGYRDEELAAVPAGANLGLGCGNPTAIAGLRAGETVLDLGSGGGFDAFLAARQVGPQGRVIGVDMTPEMVAKARDNARKAGLPAVEFRLGEIEHLPVADASVDVVISNCVVNLSPEKGDVYKEIFRVLKPGGRVAISDVVTLAPLPAALAADVAAWTGCVAGASRVEEVEGMLREAGFEGIAVTPDPASREAIDQWKPEAGLGRYLASARIEARRPRGRGRGR